jgi:hypothetical protein
LQVSRSSLGFPRSDGTRLVVQVPTVRVTHRTTPPDLRTTPPEDLRTPPASDVPELNGAPRRSTGDIAARLHRTSLRARLVTALLAMVIVAVTVLSVVSVTFMRSYQLGQVDQQLRNPARQQAAVKAVNDFLSGNPSGAQTGAALAEAGYAVFWIPAGGSPQEIVQPAQSASGAVSQDQVLPGAVPVGRRRTAHRESRADDHGPRAGIRRPLEGDQRQRQGRHPDHRGGREHRLRHHRAAHGGEPDRERRDRARAADRRVRGGAGEPAAAQRHRADRRADRRRAPGSPRTRRQFAHRDRLARSAGR